MVLLMKHKKLPKRERERERARERERESSFLESEVGSCEDPEMITVLIVLI